MSDNMNEVNDEMPVWTTHQIETAAMQHAEGEGYAFLEKGGRTKTTCEWDFEPYVLPAVMNIVDHPEGIEDGGYVVTDAYRGEPNLFMILNPNVRTEQQPAGAILGAVSSRYAIASYTDVFLPMLEHANNEGWDAKITCYDYGKKARMDINIKATVDKNDPTRQKQVGDLYNYGVTIHTSLDGSGSFKISGVAERLACTNGMVTTRSKNLMTLRHTKGGVGKIDFRLLSNAITSMLKEVEAELEQVELMTDFAMDNEMFERLLVAAKDRKILTLPNAKPVFGKGSKVIQDYNITSGYGFRASMMGWSQPEAEFVKVEGESVGTAFHAYNVLTGVLTHKPTWRGPSKLSGTGAAILEGSALAMGALDTRLQAVHSLMRDVVDGTIDLEDYVTPQEAMGIVVQ